MLTLAQASAYFDRTPVLDPDTGKVLFYGQIEPYDDSRRDAVGAYRRVLSVRPGTVVPTARAVRLFGDVWILGFKEVDGLAQEHRDKYLLQPAEVKLNVSNLSEFLVGAPRLAVWGDVQWLKDGKEEETSSAIVPTLTIYLPYGTAIREHDVVWAGADAYLVESVRRLASGLLAAIGIKLEYAVAVATHASRTYDPVLGEFTAAVNTTVNCLRVRWQSLYRYDTQGAARFQEGDASLVVPPSTLVDTSDRITLDGVVWAVLGAEAYASAQVVHARLA